jgi:hypothetical protein
MGRMLLLPVNKNIPYYYLFHDKLFMETSGTLKCISRARPLKNVELLATGDTNSCFQLR